MVGLTADDGGVVYFHPIFPIIVTIIIWMLYNIAPFYYRPYKLASVPSDSSVRRGGGGEMDVADAAYLGEANARCASNLQKKAFRRTR